MERRSVMRGGLVLAVLVGGVLGAGRAAAQAGRDVVDAGAPPVLPVPRAAEVGASDDGARGPVLGPGAPGAEATPDPRYPDGGVPPSPLPTVVPPAGASAPSGTAPALPAASEGARGVPPLPLPTPVESTSPPAPSGPPPGAPPGIDPTAVDEADPRASLARSPERRKRPKKQLLELGGHLGVQYEHKQDSNANGNVDNPAFGVQLARIQAKGRVVKGIEYEVLADFADTDNGILRDAYVDFRFIPKHRIRVGQQKTQFGYENLVARKELLTVTRTLVSTELGRGRNLRDIGIGLLGDWKLGGYVALDYGATLVNGAGQNRLEDDTPRKNLWSRAGATAHTLSKRFALRVGGSYGRGDELVNPDAAVGVVSPRYAFQRYGFDAELTSPWLAVAAEVVFGRNRGDAWETRGRGWYAMVAGRTPWDFGPLARIEEYDPDLALGGDFRRRYTLGAYYEMIPGRARLLGNAVIDASEDRKDNAWLFAGHVMF